MVNVYCGIDVGGSHVSVGLLDVHGTVLVKTEVDVNNATILPLELVNLLTGTIETIIDEDWKLCSIGIGIPGQSKNNILVAAANLPNFKNVPLPVMLSKRFNDVPAILLNDADAALCAEVWGVDSSSYYSDKKNIVMVTLGTGVGFSLLINQSLHQGSNGLVEGGHMIVSTHKNSRVCGCGQTGCIEVYSSGKNTALRLLELDEQDAATSRGGKSKSVLKSKDKSSTDSLASTAAVGVVGASAEGSNTNSGSSSNSTSVHVNGGSKEVFERYSCNDFNAVKVVEETAEHLAVFCINICRVVDPDVIIFSGGMARAGEALLSLVRKHMKRLTWTVLPTDVELCTARSIDAGGMVGAALAGKRLYETTTTTTVAAVTAATTPTTTVTAADAAQTTENASGENVARATNAASDRSVASVARDGPSDVGSYRQCGMCACAATAVIAAATLFMGSSNGRSGSSASRLVSYLHSAQLAVTLGVGVYLLVSSNK